MHRSAAVLAALALLGLGAVAPGIAPAGAAPPADVSATSGAPGTVVTVTEPTCTTDEASEDYRVLQVLLISGTTPGELLAGIGSGDGSASVVVPDWVDPDSPAVLEARCERYDPETFEPIVTSFDPVAFDVLPGPGSPTQTRTYSRTSLLAGQGLTVSHTGCTLPGATYGGLVAFEGTDLSGRAFERVVAVGEGGGLSGPDFTTGAAFTGDGFLGFSVGWDGEEPPDYELGVEEVHEPVPPGTYAAVSYCAADDGTVLIYEPQLVEVTGTAPVDQLDLTVAHGTRQVTLAGSECTAGPVTVTLEAMDVEEMFGPWDDADELRSAVRAVGPFVVPGADVPPAVDAVRIGTDAPAAGARSRRALSDDGYLDATVEPDAEGAWSLSDEVGFDQGFVSAYATCGDPFGDGWVYLPQAAVVDVAQVPPPTTTPTTTPGATPPPATPATAVVGRPTYTG